MMSTLAFIRAGTRTLACSAAIPASQCRCSDVDDDDADHADVVDIDSQTDSQVDTPETDNDNCEVCLIAPRKFATLRSRWCRVGINDFARRVPTACVTRDADVLFAEVLK